VTEPQREKARFKLNNLPSKGLKTSRLREAAF